MLFTVWKPYVSHLQTASLLPAFKILLPLEDTFYIITFPYQNLKPKNIFTRHLFLFNCRCSSSPATEKLYTAVAPANLLRQEYNAAPLPVTMAEGK